MPGETSRPAARRPFADLAAHEEEALFDLADMDATIAATRDCDAIGYHEVEAQIGVDAPVRPDSLYGVSKNFVESLSRFYWDKFGIESACLRIFSSFAEPTDRRHLWSYLSFGDCVRLVEASLTAPRVGHTLTFGISNNTVRTVDNSGANHLGFIPQDSSEPFRASVEARTPVADPKAPAVKYLGGFFCELGHPDDPKAP